MARSRKASRDTRLRSAKEVSAELKKLRKKKQEIEARFQRKVEKLTEPKKLLKVEREERRLEHELLMAQMRCKHEGDKKVKREIGDGTWKSTYCEDCGKRLKQELISYGC